MAVTYEQSAANNTSGGTSITTTLGSTPAAGSLLVAVVFTASPSTISSFTGETWTLAGSDVDSSEAYIYYATSGGSSSAFTVNFSSVEYGTLSIAEYSTDQAGFEFDQFNSLADRSTSTVTGGSITPSADVRLHVFGGGINDRQSFSSYTSSFTEREAEAPLLHGSFYADRILTASGSALNPTCTAGGSSNTVGVHATFEEIAGGQTILTLRAQGY